MLANLARTYEELGQQESALSLERDIYFGFLKLKGEEHEHTLLAANNYSASLVSLERFKEARSLMRKLLPVARSALGSSNVTTLRIGMNYARALYLNTGATLDQLREAVALHERTCQTSQRVLGSEHERFNRTERCRH